MKSPPLEINDLASATALAGEIRRARLTYCGPPKLENLASAILRALDEGVPGSFLEAGVALGGSAILIGRMKPAGRPLTLYDVFAMIPPPSERDESDSHVRYAEIVEGRSKGLGDNVYYGYQEELDRTVVANLEAFGLDLAADGISLVKGLFKETLYPVGPVAVAHIDCDWYDSVKVCIDRIEPWLSPGGFLVFDDYNSYQGCRRAVDELVARGRFEMVVNLRSVVLRLIPGRRGS